MNERAKWQPRMNARPCLAFVMLVLASRMICVSEYKLVSECITSAVGSVFSAAPNENGERDVVGLDVRALTFVKGSMAMLISA